MTPLLTIGYSGWPIYRMMESLQKNEVTVLADIRYSPSSRNPLYRKEKLAEITTGYGLRYVHIDALGNLNYAKGGPTLLKDSVVGVNEVLALIDAGEQVALMCACNNWRNCHRREAAQEIKVHAPSLDISHLEFSPMPRLPLEDLPPTFGF